MKNFKISSRIFLLLVLPLLLLTFYVIKNAKENYQEWSSLSTTASMMDLAVSFGNLTHNLQIERGATAGFVQSKGAKFANELPGYRNETDKRLAELKTQHAKFKAADLPPALKKEMEAVLSALDQLGDTRDAASQFRISAPEAAGYFTRTLAAILSTISIIAEQSSDIAITKRMVSYQAFLHAKERTGQERALMVPVFTVSKIEPAQYRAFLSHIAAQQTYLGIFSDYATAEASNLYKQKMAGESFSEVETMHKVVMDKAEEGAFGIDPTKWFGTMTAKINALREVESLITEQIQTSSAKRAQDTYASMLLTGGISIAFLLATMGFGYWIVLGITRPIHSLKDTIGEIQKNNDLTKRLDVTSEDELGQVSEAFNLLISGLQSSLNQVMASAGQVLSLSEQLTASASQVADVSHKQSESASSMAAAVEEMTVSIDQVAEHARETQNISQSSSELSNRGSGVIMKVVEDMRSIADTVHESSAIIAELGQQSDQIYSIVQVIKGIADQTNLLALNAAIEAARAGEQGRGFAVVADEVRKLAERTTRSTEDIASMIQKIQNGTKQAVASMEVGVERVNQGVSLAGQAGDAISQIQSGAQQVGVAVTDITSAIKEQSIASSEIARHVEQVAQMSEESSAAAQGNAEAAQYLEKLAISLQGAVKKFKV